MIVLLVLARTLHIGSALLLTSLLFFRLVVLREGRTEPEKAGWPIAFNRQLQRGLGGLFLLHLLSGAAWFWAVTAGMNDSSLREALDPAQLGTVLLQTQFGWLWSWRAGLALVFGALLLTGSAARGRSAGSWLALGVSGLLLGSLTWAGHAAAGTEHRIAHLGIDLAHLAIAAIWPMGLPPLALFLRAVARAGPAGPEVMPILQRFSRLSLACVILLLATGIANALFFFPSWSALVTSTYGRLLLGKVALFLVMVGLGAFNRFSFLPALMGDPASPALVRLQRAVLLESAIGLVVISIVGMMGATSPPVPGS